KKYIDFEQLTAGEYKRTLTLFGENTKKDREKMQEDIDNTHELFKNFIHENRTNIDIDKVATGEHWYGTDAISLKLIDTLQTSDDYLLAASRQADIYELCYKVKKSLGKQLAQGAVQTYHKIIGYQGHV